MEPDTKALPEDIADLRSRLESWRSAKTGRGRIPAEIWEEAAQLASKYGVSRVSSSLRMSYEGLKGRLEPCSMASASSAMPTFIEIGDLATPGSSHCLLELENAAGCKLKVSIQGSPSFDLVALGKVFLSEQS